MTFVSLGRALPAISKSPGMACTDPIAPSFLAAAPLSSRVPVFNCLRYHHSAMESLAAIAPRTRTATPSAMAIAVVVFARWFMGSA
jgi:hypothetical protein